MLFAPVLHAGSTPTGIYALSGLDSALKKAIYDDPSVTGVTLNSRWATLEPQQNQFFWTNLDTQVTQASQAGRQVILSVQPGAFAPAWVYTAGAAKFSFRWYLSWGQTLCSMATIPLPWDPVYLNAWAGFVHALANHYANNPAVVGIKLTGINATSAEILLPYTSTGHVIGGSVCGAAQIAPVSAWKAAGYLPSKMTAAWNTVVQMFVASFPTQQLIMETGPWAFPPSTTAATSLVAAPGT